MHVFDYRRELPKEHLLPQEVPLIAKALAESGAVCAQRSPPLSLRTLKMLLRLSKVKRVQLGTDRKGDALVLEGGPVLYRRGEEYGYCYFLLEGEASEDGGGRRVTAGTTVGAEALARLEGGKGFVAAVGVRLTTDARVVLISRLDLDEILELQVKEGA